ncbi:MAG: dephospho-CoA kinase [Marinifilaceae bacterium]
MLKVGITGGIGSGKSLVCRVFEVLNVPVYYADEEARQLTDQHPEIQTQLKGYFGTDIYSDAATLDRKKLAGIVFHNKTALQRLNSIVHPVVRAHFRDWLEEHRNAPYIIQEAAILYESGLYKKLDKVIVVTAPIDLRIDRVMRRDQVSKEDVLSRINNQMPEEEKVARADFVIQNDEITMLIPQILRIHQALLENQ